MTRPQIILLSIVLVLVVLVTFQQTGVFSEKKWFGKDNSDAGVSSGETGTGRGHSGAGQNWARPNPELADTMLTFADIQKLFANLDANQRQAYLNNEETFNQYIRQEASNLSVLAAARVNQVDKDENTAYLMQRSADNILRESYLTRLIAEKIPADFPTPEQVQQYYESNKEGFVLDERLHVWQIFFQIKNDMDKKAVAALQTQADKILKDIKNNKIDFADAAMQYSEHGASKVNGGYMGLIKVSELKPELSKALLSLPEDKLSQPIKSDTGIHLLKRGAKIAKQPVNLNQVQAQIRELLFKQARIQLRQAIYEQASKTYPIDLKDNKVEEWRLRLRTNLPGAGTGASE